MRGHGKSFSIIIFTFQVRKVMGGIVQLAMLVCAAGYVVVACRIILKAPV